MTLGLDVLLVLFLAAAVVWLVRTVGRLRSVDGDAATAVLVLACEHLPAARADWGRAMLTELSCVDGRTARWRFALGGVRAALSARLFGRMTGQPDLSVVVAGALVCAGLVVAALVTYPALLRDSKLPLLLGVLIVVLIGYLLIASARARRTTPAVRGTRATGLIAGVVLVSCGWCSPRPGGTCTAGRSSPPSCCPLSLAATSPVAPVARWRP